MAVVHGPGQITRSSGRGCVSGRAASSSGPTPCPTADPAQHAVLVRQVQGGVETGLGAIELARRQPVVQVLHVEQLDAEIQPSKSTHSCKIAWNVNVSLGQVEIPRFSFTTRLLSARGTAVAQNVGKHFRGSGQRRGGLPLLPIPTAGNIRDAPDADKGRVRQPAGQRDREGLHILGQSSGKAVGPQWTSADVADAAATDTRLPWVVAWEKRGSDRIR